MKNNKPRGDGFETQQECKGAQSNLVPGPRGAFIQPCWTALAQASQRKRLLVFKSVLGNNTSLLLRWWWWFPFAVFLWQIFILPLCALKNKNNLYMFTNRYLQIITLVIIMITSHSVNNGLNNMAVCFTICTCTLVTARNIWNIFS